MSSLRPILVADFCISASSDSHGRRNPFGCHKVFLSSFDGTPTTAGKHNHSNRDVSDVYCGVVCSSGNGGW